MTFFPDFAPNSRKEWRLSIFNQICENKFENFRNFWNFKFVKIIQFYSILFNRVLSPGGKSRYRPAWRFAANRSRPGGSILRPSGFLIRTGLQGHRGGPVQWALQQCSVWLLARFWTQNVTKAYHMFSNVREILSDRMVWHQPSSVQGWHVQVTCATMQLCNDACICRLKLAAALLCGSVRGPRCKVARLPPKIT